MTPFAGGLDSLPNGTLLFSAAAAILYLLAWNQPPSWRRMVAGPAALVLLAVLVLLENGPWPLALVLALAGAGEAWIAQRGGGAFLYGQAGWALRYVALATLTLALLL